MRQDFPFWLMRSSTTPWVMCWARPGLDDRTRQLIAVSAFAATGNIQVLKVHAGYALKMGVKLKNSKEVVYLTTVTAGFPRAIDAAQALREVFAAEAARSVK